MKGEHTDPMVWTGQNCQHSLAMVAVGGEICFAIGHGHLDELETRAQLASFMATHASLDASSPPRAIGQGNDGSIAVIECTFCRGWNCCQVPERVVLNDSYRLPCQLRMSLFFHLHIISTECRTKPWIVS